MKKLIFSAIAGAGLFAAGYWAGKGNAGHAADNSREGPVAAAVAAGPSNVAGSVKSADPEREVRAFAPGRPFAKGGARAWLLALAANLGEGSRGNEALMVDTAQIFMTMNEACAAEVAGALLELLAQYEAGDPALRAIEDGDNMAEGALLLTVFRLSQLNPPAALDILQKLPKGVPDEATKLVFSRLAASDPGRAEAMVPSLPEQQRGDALKAILGVISAKDPKEALTFAERYPDKIGHYELNRILARVVETDPMAAISSGVRLAEKSGETDALRHAFYQWLEKDQAAAMDWADRHEGTGKTAIQAMLLEKSVGDDPQAAIAAFHTLAAASEQKAELSDVAAEITQALTKRDPAMALPWIESIADGSLRSRAVLVLAENWIGSDPEAASEWIRSLPEGDDRDLAAGKLAQEITRRDPASAFEWARNIQNVERRMERLKEVLQQWRQQDPNAAKAAVAALPAAMRESVK